MLVVEDVLAGHYDYDGADAQRFVPWLKNKKQHKKKKAQNKSGGACLDGPRVVSSYDTQTVKDFVSVTLSLFTLAIL